MVPFKIPRLMTRTDNISEDGPRAVEVNLQTLMRKPKSIPQIELFCSLNPFHRKQPGGIDPFHRSKMAAGFWCALLAGV